MTTSGAAAKNSPHMLNLPNLLTLSRIAAIPLVVACFWLEHGWAQWLSAGLFAAACVTDWFDGYFARRYAPDLALRPLPRSRSPTSFWWRRRW